MRRREFSVGTIVGESFSIYMSNLIPFALMSIVLHSPMIIFYYMLFEGNLPVSFATFGPLVFQMLLQFVLTGALVFGVYQHVRGQPASIDQCISKGFSRLLPVLGVAIVVGICVGLGMLLLLVPGLIFMCMWWLAVPIAVVERGGVGGALSRSAALTKGHRWSVLGIVLVIGIIGAVLGVIVGQIAPALTFGGALVNLALSALLSPWGASAQALGYHDLRAQKEGVDIEAIAGVFD